MRFLLSPRSDSIPGGPVGQAGKTQIDPRWKGEVLKIIKRGVGPNRKVLGHDLTSKRAQERPLNPCGDLNSC